MKILMISLLFGSLQVQAKPKLEFTKVSPTYEKKCFRVHEKDDGSFLKGSPVDICEISIGTNGLRFCAVDPNTQGAMAISCDLFDSLNGKN